MVDLLLHAFEQAELDHSLAHQVGHVLQVLQIPALRRLEILARDGLITLHGTVRTYYQRQVAIAAARRTPGVRDVVDQIEVHAAAEPIPATGRIRLTA